MKKIVTNSYGDFICGPDYISVQMSRFPAEYMWDAFLKPVYEKYLNKDSVVIEVGANIGTHTVYLSKICKKVYAFEPQKPIYYQLCGNLFLNDCFNVDAYNLAVYDKECFMKLTTGEIDHTNDNRAPMLGYTVSENGVRAVTIDSFKLNPNFIKIDAQGSDLRVLYGAKETIQRCKPVIAFEIEDESLLKPHGITPQDHFNFLDSINYNVVSPEKSNFVAFPK